MPLEGDGESSGAGEGGSNAERAAHMVGSVLQKLGKGITGVASTVVGGVGAAASAAAAAAASACIGSGPSTSGMMAPKTPVEEMRASEEAYMRGLVDVRTNYFPKLRTLITAPEAKAFFGNWAELIPASQDLLAALHDDPTTAAALTTHLPRLKAIYSKYCAGIPAAQALYERKLGDRAFFEFESSFTHLNKPTLNYIMRPVQRIMKYPLLIHEIRKSLPKDHPDQAALAAANVEATALAAEANASMTSPVRRLDKIDISQPAAESFQVVATLAGAEDNSILSMVGPEVWAQAEAGGTASDRLMLDLISTTMEFEGYHSVMLDRFQQRVHATDLGTAAGLWDVVLGTTMMQCELAGDMHASLALLMGAVTVTADYDTERIKDLAKEREAFGSVPATVTGLQHSRFELEELQSRFREAQERLRTASAAIATDPKAKASALLTARSAATKAADEYGKAAEHYVGSHSTFKQRLLDTAQAYEDADAARFAATRGFLSDYFNFYSRRNETATAVLESSLLKLGAREPKFGASALSSATIAESVLPPRHEFTPWRLLPIHDGAGPRPAWLSGNRFKSTARDAGHVLSRVVAWRIMPLLRRVRDEIHHVVERRERHDDANNSSSSLASDFDSESPSAGAASVSLSHDPVISMLLSPGGAAAADAGSALAHRRSPKRSPSSRTVLTPRGSRAGGNGHDGEEEEEEEEEEVDEEVEKMIRAATPRMRTPVDLDGKDESVA